MPNNHRGLGEGDDGFRYTRPLHDIVSRHLQAVQSLGHDMCTVASRSQERVAKGNHLSNDVFRYNGGLEIILHTGKIPVEARQGHYQLYTARGVCRSLVFFLVLL